MSKLGFDKILRDLESANNEFLHKAMKASQKEFKRNFDTESDAETGQGWDMVLRAYPPPMLDVTGELRAQALSAGNVAYMSNKAVLTVDPLDERGRGYAAFHQEGTPSMPKRRFITQSAQLTKEHKEILLEVQDKLYAK